MQCRDFPQSYVVIPLALATRNLFHNFLSCRSLLPYKINNFKYTSHNLFSSGERNGERRTKVSFQIGSAMMQALELLQ